MSGAAQAWRLGALLACVLPANLAFGAPDAAATRPGAEPPALDTSPWEKRTDLLKAPPTAAREAALTGLSRQRLRNGLSLVVVPRPGLPLVTVRMAVKAGRNDEPADRLGVSPLTAGLLLRGDEKGEAAARLRALQIAGGTFTSDVGADASVLGCSVLPSDLGACLDLLRDLVLRPAFLEKETEALRGELIRQLTGQRQNSNQLGIVHFDNLVFGEEHPQGRIPTVEDFKRLTRDDVLRFYEALYRPNNALLAVAGAVDAARARREIESRFGAWKTGPVPARPEFVMPERKGARILLVDADDAAEALVMVGHRAPAHGHPEWYGAELLATALGGGERPSRLQRALETPAGVIRGVGAGLDASLAGGALRVNAVARNEGAWAAALAIVTELRRVKTEGLPGDELERVRGWLIGQHALGLQTNEGLVGALVDAEVSRLGVPYVKQLGIRFGRLDEARVKQTAASLLEPDHAVVVLVGRADLIAPQLEKAKLKFERVHVREPVSYVERARRRRALATAASTGAAQKALALVRQGLDAQGGLERFQALKDIKIVKSGIRREDGVILDVFVTSYYQRPDRLRIEQEVVAPGGKSRNVVVIGPAGVKAGAHGGALSPVPPVNSKRLRAAAFEDPNFILVNILQAKPPLPMQLAPTVEEEGGRVLDAVSLRVPSGEWMTLFFDRKSHLLVRAKSTTEGGEEVVESFEDYRAVGPYKFSYRQRSPGARGGSEATVKEIRINAGLPPALFQ